MEKSEWIHDRAEDQRKRRFQDILRPGLGAKLSPHCSEQEKKARVNLLLSKELEAISTQRTNTLKCLSKGRWNSATQLVEVTQQLGSHWKTHGHRHKAHNCLVLLPWEALFLLECGSLQLLSDGLPMTTQQAFHCLLQPNELSLYQVYASLKRSGYVVRKKQFQRANQENVVGEGDQLKDLKKEDMCPVCAADAVTGCSDAVLEVYSSPSSLEATPSFRVLTASATDAFPSVEEIQLMATTAGVEPSAPVKFAVVCLGQVSFYSLTPDSPQCPACTR